MTQKKNNKSSEPSAELGPEDKAVAVLYFVLLRRQLSAPTDDVRSGLFSALAEWAGKQVKLSQGESGKFLARHVDLARPPADTAAHVADGDNRVLREQDTGSGFKYLSPARRTGREVSLKPARGDGILVSLHPRQRR